MRLLYTANDGRISWTKDYISVKDIPPYAILSHTWQEEQEVTFDDLTNTDNVKVNCAKSKEGYEKIRFCAQQAKRDGLDYFWVDTCCINKDSSAELTEAINSMFRWYQDAERCYVYLPDITIGVADEVAELSQQLKESRWFTRGWTLQELIAPASVEFFSKDQQRLGDKRSLENILHGITGIAVQALRGRHLSNFSVNERMSWADRRETTRAEDAAYCLLGVFGIHMPLIYGEGQDRALNRLRKEITESMKD
ncbi:HET-domain-containing protein, partial [Ophiobolus disseminans]